jgi:outer membrane protein
VISTSPYQGADNKVIPIPLLMFSGKQFFVRGTGAGIHVYQDEQLSLDLLGKYRFAAYEAGDSAFLAGMRDRDSTVEAGAAAEWRYKQVALSCTVLTDLLNEHGGQEITLRVKKPFRWRMLFVAPYLGISLRSDDFSSYYYGVDAEEALAGRPEYRLDQTVSRQAGMNVRIGLTRNILLTALLGLELFDQDIADSPIIARDSRFFSMIGLAYGF